MTTATATAPPVDIVPAATPQGILLVKDVAEMLGVARSTVLSYLKESRPMVGTKPGRYAGHPFPEPKRMAPATTLWWPASAAAKIRAWDAARPTQSHGKGRQAKGKRGPDRRTTGKSAQ